MGRTKNSGLGIGTGSSPQGNITQSTVDSRIEEIAKSVMIAELEKAGVKYNKDDVLFVAKDKTGQMVWLETGNEKAGFEHIKKHTSDFVEKHGIKPESLKSHLFDIITKGEVLSSKSKILENGKLGLEKIYLYSGKYYALGAIGTNGYLVSMYPLGGNKNEDN